MIFKRVGQHNKKCQLKHEILKIIPESMRGNLVGDELFFLCPNPDHDDEVPTNCSINLNTGIFYCFACGYKGNLNKLKKLLQNSNKETNNCEKNPFDGSFKCKSSRRRIWL